MKCKSIKSICCIVCSVQRIRMCVLSAHSSGVTDTSSSKSQNLRKSGRNVRRDRNRQSACQLKWFGVVRNPTSAGLAKTACAGASFLTLHERSIFQASCNRASMQSRTECWRSMNGIQKLISIFSSCLYCIKMNRCKQISNFYIIISLIHLKSNCNIMIDADVLIST